MDRRRLIAGNWKMNKTPEQTEAFLDSFLRLRAEEGSSEILLLPPFTGLECAGRLLADTSIGLGAQNVHFEQAGAFTGEISAAMLLSCGCRYVLVGHSERRTLFLEDDRLINRKLRAAFSAGLSPVLCVGETLEEHRLNRVKERITSQLAAGLRDVDNTGISSVVIAYEPIWAIGTGETAGPEQAEETIGVIRGWIADTYGEREAAAVRILYGGSVNPDNTTSLIAQANIDGVLVGGASLDPDSFARIVVAADTHRGV